MAYEMNDLLNLVVDEGASDLHLQVGQPPTLRTRGSMVPVEGPLLEPSDTEELMKAISSDGHQQKVKTEGGADFGFQFMDKARFRVSILRAKGNVGLVLRQIPSTLFTLRQIGLPDKISELLSRPRGLILVTGPTGSGKSTTLASMINWINENRDGHIITIEDPIEYFHEHKNCIVTQREVGVDVPSFADAIRGALRQDPDVILVGEMRDLATIEAAISAAETGHLVFGTLHTTGAARTVDRIIDAFPGATKDQVRTQLASSIVSVISQVLCKNLKGGRIAGFEIMINTTSIAGLMGNFGQSNYSAAKAAIYGLTRTCSMELAKDGVTVNAIAPVAKTAMTEDLDAVPQEMEPEMVSPLVVFLASELAADVSGRVFGCHGNHYFEYAVKQTDGVEKDALWTPTEIAEELGEIGKWQTAAASAASADSPEACVCLPPNAPPQRRCTMRTRLACTPSTLQTAVWTASGSAASRTTP